ncbi:acyl-CoA synthetase [Plasmodium sp. DRC-Itaito]|uniref:Acyl-CoA synthetase n=1 Tax=Plasmodium gaboni TaxID=647221 RepID=A0ABY0KX16_9APIC|nr:acyl-CoA synthetase [Plasmodium gaboni]SOV22093.1 acyl-CoA synthetase [Plasmodium sp. DRC-Itaito]
MNILFTVCSLFIFVINVALYGAERNRKNNVYTEICENPANENESSVYCMKDYKKKNSSYPYKHIMNFLLDTQSKNKDNVAIVEHENGEPNNYLTYGDFFKKVFCFSNTLNTYEGKGIEEKIYKNEEKNNGKFRLLGLYGSNSMNWLAADMASMLSGVTTLVMHSKFSVDVIVDIIKETELEWLCLDLDLVEGLLAHRNEFPHLKNLIILDTLDKSNKIKSKGLDKSDKKKTKEVDNKLGNVDYDNEKLKKIKDLKDKASSVGINIMEFDEMANTEPKEIKINNEDPNFITSIVYTSGTSGKPKGVMLSNENFHNTIVPLCDHNLIKEYHPKTHFSYLPVSHIYERVLVHIFFVLGGTISIWSKDISIFSKDLSNSKGEVLAGVPKVFNRIYTNIMTEISNLPCFKRWLVKRIISIRKSNNNGSLGKFLEGLFKISSKIKKKVNTNLEVILNGGGKLSPKIANELRVLLNINFYQGYGLTESTGPIFAQDTSDTNTESMGIPVSPNTKYKVKTWETYKATDTLPKGELLVKSGSIFSGYFLEKENTEKSFTEDGYFKTGDVVQVNSDGSLTFLDRSKGLVKLSQGEYIETDLLNNLYSQISFINNCVVYGDDSMDGPLGIISVDKYLLYRSLKDDNMLEKTGITDNNYQDQLNDENINQSIFVDYVKEKMMETYKNTNLNRYNIINHIYLTSKVWDTNNYLTPTLKVKRFYVFKDYDFFIEEVKKIYKHKLKGIDEVSKNKEQKEEKKDEKNKSKNKNVQEKSSKDMNTKNVVNVTEKNPTKEKFTEQQENKEKNNKLRVRVNDVAQELESNK